MLPVQHGDPWRGSFLPGEMSACYCSILVVVVKHSKQLDGNRDTAESLPDSFQSLKSLPFFIDREHLAVSHWPHDPLSPQDLGSKAIRGSYLSLLLRAPEPYCLQALPPQLTWQQTQQQALGIRS